MNLFFDATAWQQATARALIYLPRLGAAVLLLLLFWLAGSIVQRLIRRLGERRNVQSDAMNVLARTCGLSLQIVGLITALGTLGVDVTALVAGLGLTGFALGFALKDIISNLLAGMLLLAQKPFQRQDRISVQGFTPPLEGVVSHIDLRYTTLELPDRKILIPNSNLFTNPIIVFHHVAPDASPAIKPAAG
jgi:small conductance mechanosensitive channel